MADANVAERLKTFIDWKGLSYAQFADSCKIPRPSLSQLLTGRNKKINDIMVGQIHNQYPELSIIWLLFGEGQMLVSSAENKDLEDRKSVVGFDDDLFSISNFESEGAEKIIFAPDDTAKRQKLDSEGLQNPFRGGQNLDDKTEKLQQKIKQLQLEIESLKKNPRKVEHITVYFDDSTFESFYPRG